MTEQRPQGGGWVGPPSAQQHVPGAMFTRTYKARTQAEAARKMQADGNRPGYALGGQSWAQAGRSCAAQGFVVVGILFLMGGLLFPPFWAIAVICLVIGLVSGRGGELTVTWVPASMPVPPVAAPTSAVAAPAAPRRDQVASLAALKSMLDQGLVTPEEYEAKKAELLASL